MIEQYIEKNKQRFLDELFDLIRIPSVSAQEKRKEDVLRAAHYLVKKVKDMGLDVELVSTKGHPIVLGKYFKPENKKTILCYGHYDVQPEDPINEWISPPFEPTIRNNNIYARGATDDKGQMYAVVKGIETALKVKDKLSCNLILLIEGEEEFGTENLDEFIKQNKNQLKADYALICDTSQVGPQMPAITYGLRGICTFELIFKGANTDLHSGLYGGVVRNPLQALAQFISKLHDEDGRVAIPHFYDGVLKLEEWEREMWAKLPDLDSQLKQTLSLTDLHGEEGFTSYERNWARPTCEINGILGGYVQDGFKTVIGKKAMTKISFRLVPNQDSEKIIKNFEDFIEKNVPRGITYELQNFGGSNGIFVNPESEGMKLASQAIEKGFGKKPFFIRSGGSIPVVGMLKNYLNMDSILIGLGQPDDNLHAPNEKFHLPDFYRGIATVAHFLTSF